MIAVLTFFLIFEFILLVILWNQFGRLANRVLTHEDALEKTMIAVKSIIDDHEEKESLQ